MYISILIVCFVLGEGSVKNDFVFFMQTDLQHKNLYKNQTGPKTYRQGNGKSRNDKCHNKYYRPTNTDA
jgi:hypothetical protein